MKIIGVLFHYRMAHRHKLNDYDIALILQASEESEDGIDFDDDSLADPDFDPDLEEFIEEHLEDEIDLSMQNNNNLISNPDEQPTPSSANLSNSTGPTEKRQKPEKRILQWKKKNLELDAQQLAFTGNELLSSDILDLETPLQFFLYLFPKELIQKISVETNLYLTQKNPNNNFNVSELEIQQFIGMVYIMSLIQLPRVTNHWSSVLGTPLIQQTMTANKFEKIRQYLHFNDNSKCLPRNNPDTDRIFKIRPVVDALNEAYSKVPLEPRLCVDEQICSTKARNTLKRYNPKKPHKWGYKLNVLSGLSGFAYNTEIESGKENIVRAEEPDLGASSNVVVRLSRMIPRRQNYKVYFDNYFTSLHLLEYLAKEGIYGLGTIRRNRIPNCKLPSEKELLNKDRGYSEEYVANVGGVDVSTTVWKDNKIVTLASTFAGQNPVGDVRRYDRKKSEYTTIRRPHIVSEYNQHMGGVDLIDSIMGTYKIRLRSKRWQVRIFYHYLDLTMSNSWLLYKRVCKYKNLPVKGIISSANFRLEVGETLCKMGIKPTLKTRRNLENEIEAKKHRGPAQRVPPKEVRQDQVGHWPQWTNKKIRCKYPKCSGFTHTMCEKCGVALCYIRAKNCFKKFHLS